MDIKNIDIGIDKIDTINKVKTKPETQKSKTTISRLLILKFKIKMDNGIRM